MVQDLLNMILLIERLTFTKWSETRQLQPREFDQSVVQFTVLHWNLHKRSWIKQCRSVFKMKKKTKLAFWCIHVPSHYVSNSLHRLNNQLERFLIRSFLHSKLWMERHVFHSHYDPVFRLTRFLMLRVWPLYRIGSWPSLYCMSVLLNWE